jgi:predicted outer membrane repeat protein/VCBS repeat-containing protein
MSIFRSQKLLLFMALIMGSLFYTVPPPAHAAVFQVPCGDNAVAALITAVEAANAAPGHDIIQLELDCPYTFTTAYAAGASGPNALPVITDALTIEGNHAQLIRSWQGESVRFIATDQYIPLALKNLSLIGGRVGEEGQSLSGGAILARGSLNLENVYFLNNSATGSGGAVYSIKPDNNTTTFLSINGSLFEENWSTNRGGAVFTTASLIMNNSDFYSNWSTDGDGGGIFVLAGNAVIQNSVLAGNYAYNGSGGGLGSQFSAITVLGTDFHDNVAAQGSGGGLFFQSDFIAPVIRPLTVAGSRFQENSAGSGGAMGVIGANLSLERSTFSGNEATNFGHALSIAPYRDSPSRIVNNLIVAKPATQVGTTIMFFWHASLEGAPGIQNILHNTVVKPGGGGNTAIYIMENAGTLNIVDNIITGFLNGLDVAEGATAVFSGFNLYHGTSASGPQQGPIHPYSGGSNLVAEPQFVNAAAGDYRLQTGSPAVDSGVNVGVTTDITGLFRPQGTTVDRGAYEYTETNTAPVAAGDAYQTPQNSTLTISSPGVLANDSDADGDQLIAVPYSQPAHGVLTMAEEGSFTYTPNSGYAGTDSFTYRAYDGEDHSNVATVSITVEAVNSPPVAASDAYATQANLTLTITAPGVLDNDTDADGDPLSAVLASQTSHGTVSLSPIGGFNYVPDNGFTGTDSFTYTASDGEDSSIPATVTINVVAANVNLPPVAVGDSYATTQDTVLNVPSPGVLSNDSDADGDPLVASLVSGPAHGSLALNTDGSFTYSPASGVTGVASFTYRASDGQAQSNIATVTITVEAANHAPVAIADSYATLAGTSLDIAAPGVLDNDEDADGDPLVAVLESASAHGAVTLNPDGSFSYLPDSGYSGEDSFSYTAFDGSASSNVAAVTITIVAGEVNLPPVAIGDNYTAAFETPLQVAAPGVLTNDSDVQGEPLTAVLQDGPAHGTLQLNEDGSFTYLPATGYTGEDSFRYVASDGQAYSSPATVRITVLPQQFSHYLFLPALYGRVE